LENIQNLKKELSETFPEHDTPVGVLHPYWARKPLNIIEVIISNLSQEGDVVLDPFMGSGTTVFGAIKNNRTAIGSDLNPLSYSLVDGILSFQERPFQKIEELKVFVNEFSNQVLEWFKWDDDFYIERERFNVQGDFRDGKFNMSTVEVVLKKKIDGKWRKRTTINNNFKREFDKNAEIYLNDPIDFDNINLLKNSRIAIPEGARLSHFYTLENRAAINLALRLIDSKNFDPDTKKVIKLLISSALTLLRLSDKKASSQWPYWRPKTELTSRNPAIVLENRLKKIIAAAKWVKCNTDSNYNDYAINNSKDSKSINVSLYNEPIQNLPDKIIPKSSVDLIVTDPPYSDQVPYLEYSALWLDILGLGSKEELFQYEIVETDAPGRESDSEEFLLRLKSGLIACGELIKNKGFLVIFYQDWDLNSWNMLYEVTNIANLELREIATIPKQRRSMKTVTSPGKTLDGDQILIFQKNYKADRNENNTKYNLKDKVSEVLIETGEDAELFDKYAAVVKDSMKNHWIKQLAVEYNDLSQLIK